MLTVKILKYDITVQEDNIKYASKILDNP